MGSSTNKLPSQFKNALTRHPTLRRVAGRLAFLPIAIIILMTIAFFIVNLVPSSPAKVVLGNLAGHAQIVQFNQEHGLVGGIFDRYWHFIDAAFHGSLGSSYYDGSSVIDGIGTHLASTLELVLFGFIIAIVLGTTLGALSAYYRGSWIDTVVRGLVSIIQSVPDFVIGLIGATLLAYGLRILPAPVGQLPVSITPPNTITGAALIDALLRAQWSVALSALRQLILPACALGIFNSVVFARSTRSTMAATLDSPYVQFARSRGLKERTIVALALRSSLVPIITYSAVVVASLLGGTAVVETAFAWQGLGQWAITGILRSDLPVAEGFVLVCGVFVIAIYLLSDLLTLAVDPRLRLGRGRNRTATTAAFVLPDASRTVSEATFAERVEESERPLSALIEGASTVTVLAPPFQEAPLQLATTGNVTTVVATDTSVTLTPHRRVLRELSDRGVLQISIGIAVVGLLVLAAFFAPLPHNPSTPYPNFTLASPSARFWLGTDGNGYDVFSRVIAAARTDVPIALLGALIGAAIGTPLGVLVSSESHWAEAIMRVVDLIQSLPVVLVAVVIAATSQGGNTAVIFAIALVNAPLFIRIVRAGAMTVRRTRYVEAARAFGARPLRIAVRYIFPNLLDLVLAQLSISIGFAILAIAALSYLGAGLPLSTPTWGGMINQGASVIGVGKWWTVVAPTVAIAITVCSFNLVADGLQRFFSIGSRR